MGVSHDHGLDINNDYVVIASSFKLLRNIKNLMRPRISFKSHSQVNEDEVMTLGQLDLIFYLIENIKY